MKANAVDYYTVLGIDQSSTIIEIKKSFRKKAKELHPDLQGGESMTAASEAMALLVKAYKVLSDPVQRKKYDQGRVYFKPRTNEYQFNYREFLQSQPDDFHSQSKLIFYDLLNSQPEEALELYNALLSKDEFVMEKWMERGDYLECVFLLAEEFEKIGEYGRAFEYLKTIYSNEQDRPFFKHFIDEVVDRMKNLVCFKMMDESGCEEVLHRLGELVDFNFSKKDNAFFYKKMAEVAVKIGKREEALRYLKLGLENNKRLSGIKKLKERIGI